jgi:hypothetical protein
LTPFSAEVTTTSTVPAPVNLEAVEIGETSLKLIWGPSQPGELYPSQATARSLIVNWPPARDDAHGPVTYTVSKNGKVINRGLTRLWAKVGFTLSVRSFRACVWAVNTIGKSGPQMCATFTGS